MKPPSTTKRRCAGCNRVIDGRPNKRYCSETCASRIRTARYENREESSRVSVPSVVRTRSNGVLIDRVAQLGYIQPPVMDMTYGRGGFWTMHKPDPLFGWKDDFFDIPEDNTFPTVVFDPPYISTGTRQGGSMDDFYDRYGLEGLKGWKAIRALIERGMDKAERLLSEDGRLLVKCMDYVESGHKVWNTFHVACYGQDALGLTLEDRFIHVTGGGAQPQTNLDGSPRQQKRAREVSSMLLVFTR